MLSLFVYVACSLCKRKVNQVPQNLANLGNTQSQSLHHKTSLLHELTLVIKQKKYPIFTFLVRENTTSDVKLEHCKKLSTNFAVYKTHIHSILMTNIPCTPWLATCPSIFLLQLFCHHLKTCKKIHPDTTQGLSFSVTCGDKNRC